MVWAWRYFVADIFELSTAFVLAVWPCRGALDSPDRTDPMGAAPSLNSPPSSFGDSVSLRVGRVWALGDGGVQLPQHLPQPPHQHDFAKRIPLRRRFARSHLRPVPDRIAQLPKPAQGGVFDGGFVEVHKMDLNKQFIDFTRFLMCWHGFRRLAI